MQREEEVLCNFSLQGKKWKSIFIFFHAVSLLQTLLQGITGWVGEALSPQSGRQQTVTTVIWERCRLLQITAVEEWLAQSWAGEFKYFLMTFNPQSNQNATLSLHCKTQIQCVLSSHHALLTAFQKIWDYLKLTDYFNRWDECDPPVEGLMLNHIIWEQPWEWDSSNWHTRDVELFETVWKHFFTVNALTDLTTQNTIRPQGYATIQFQNVLDVIWRWHQPKPTTIVHSTRHVRKIACNNRCSKR